MSLAAAGTNRLRVVSNGYIRLGKPLHSIWQPVNRSAETKLERDSSGQKSPSESQRVLNMGVFRVQGLAAAVFLAARLLLLPAELRDQFGLSFGFLKCGSIVFPDHLRAAAADGE